MASLRNVDYTDRELLHVIARVRDDEGVASSDEIATALGIGNGNGHRSAAGRVSTRLSWMRRYGFVERVSARELSRKGTHAHWIITLVGEQLMSGRLNAATQRTIEEAGPGSALLLMRHLTRHAYVNASAPVASAVRREYLHHAAQRPR